MTQFLNKKYKYELAQEKDGEEISALLEKTAFNGDISLVYAKRPNAVISFQKDALKCAIVVGRDVATNEIKGAGICQIFEMFIDGKKENIAYLGGLRIDENSTLNIIEAYKILENFIKENNVKYTYTTILRDNIYAQKMLEKERKLMPRHRKISDYTVNIYKSKAYYKKNCQKANDINQLKSFIEETSKDKIFFPVITDYNDFYVLKDKNNEILACGKLWSQTDYKQLIIKKYSLKFKILKYLSKPILKLLGFPLFPNENQVIEYQTLSFVLYKNEEVLKEFIKGVSSFAKGDFFVYGTTKKINKNFAPITYSSYVYIVDWDKNIDLNKILFQKKNNIYIECALL